VGITRTLVDPAMWVTTALTLIPLILLIIPIGTTIITITTISLAITTITIILVTIITTILTIIIIIRALIVPILTQFSVQTTCRVGTMIPIMVEMIFRLAGRM
jgi:hypothetical protein